MVVTPHKDKICRRDTGGHVLGAFVHTNNINHAGTLLESYGNMIYDPESIGTRSWKVMARRYHVTWKVLKLTSRNRDLLLEGDMGYACSSSFFCHAELERTCENKEG